MTYRSLRDRRNAGGGDPRPRALRLPAPADAVAWQSKPTRARRALATFLVVLVLVLGTHPGKPRASADESDLALLLAQTCAVEISLQPSANECPLMWAVNARRGERAGVSLAAQVRAHTPYWRSAYRRSLRPWIAQLSRSGERPADWPDTMSWPRHRPRWLRYVVAADAFVAALDAGIRPRHAGKADTYGARCDDDAIRGRRTCDLPPCEGAQRVPLGRTLQTYWDTDTCGMDARVASGDAD